MGNPLRSFIALLLALLVASPLCCCAAASVSPVETRSCCSGRGNDAPERNAPDHACPCKAKEPRELAKEIQLPALAALDVPPASPAPGNALAGAVLEVVRPATDAASPPPRARLSWYSRWLI